MADNPDCIFCRIAAGDFDTTFVAETDNVVAFDDISPQAPVHVLVIPRRHIQDVLHVPTDDGDVWSEILAVVHDVAKAKGVDESGFRLIANTGADSGQEVPHFHFHVIGGEKLGRLV